MVSKFAGPSKGLAHSNPVSIATIHLFAQVTLVHIRNFGSTLTSRKQVNSTLPVRSHTFLRTICERRPSSNCDESCLDFHLARTPYAGILFACVRPCIQATHSSFLDSTDVAQGSTNDMPSEQANPPECLRWHFHGFVGIFQGRFVHSTTLATSMFQAYHLYLPPISERSKDHYVAMWFISSVTAVVQERQTATIM